VGVSVFVVAGASGLFMGFILGYFVGLSLGFYFSGCAGCVCFSLSLSVFFFVSVFLWAFFFLIFFLRLSVVCQLAS